MRKEISTEMVEMLKKFRYLYNAKTKRWNHHYDSIGFGQIFLEYLGFYQDTYNMCLVSIDLEKKCGYVYLDGYMDDPDIVGLDDIEECLRLAYEDYGEDDSSPECEWILHHKGADIINISNRRA